MRIQLCGPLVLEADGRRRDQDIPGRQAAALFAYLVVNRRRCLTRDELLDAIWGDHPPPQPYTALRALMSKLRAVAGPDFVTGRDTITVALPADVWVDLEVATEALHRAETAVARGDSAGAWGPSRVGLFIADRGFLPGHSGRWIDDTRTTLTDLGRRALRCVAAAGVALGGAEVGAAENAARRLVAEAPLEEDGHRLLMRALIARGEVAGALQAYETLRGRLREELGADPGPETRALHRHALELATTPQTLF